MGMINDLKGFVFEGNSLTEIMGGNVITVGVKVKINPVWMKVTATA
jgi:hypothetical protein